MYQVDRRMKCAIGTAAVGFAAFAGALGKRSPNDQVAGGELSYARTQMALGVRELGVAEWLIHVLQLIIYKIWTESKSENTMRKCSLNKNGLKQM